MDPNPIKHLGTLMKRIRDRIEPTLIDHGFALGDQSTQFPVRHRRWFEYHGDDVLVCITYEQHEALLTAEALDREGICRAIASLRFGPFKTTNDLLPPIDDFCDQVIEFVRRTFA